MSNQQLFDFYFFEVKKYGQQFNILVFGLFFFLLSAAFVANLARTLCMTDEFLSRNAPFNLFYVVNKLGFYIFFGTSNRFKDGNQSARTKVVFLLVNFGWNIWKKKKHQSTTPKFLLLLFILILENLLTLYHIICFWLNSKNLEFHIIFFCEFNRF